MSRLSGWITRLRRSLSPSRFDSEMEAEMQAHRELEAAALRKSGMGMNEAERQAAISFGSAEVYKEQVRDGRFGLMLHQFWADTKYALRQFRNEPGFAFVAICTLTLGIGASTAVFSALDGIMFRPLPYPESHRLALLLELIPGNQINNASGGAFIDWRTHQTSFDAISLTGDVTHNARYRNTLEKLSGAEVTHEYFDVLGIKPVIGRTFSASEDQPHGDSRVVVLTETYWKSRFAGSPTVLNETLVLDEVPYTVIGVVPADRIRPETQYIVPAVAVLSQEGKYSRGFHWAVVLGRLKAGVSLEQAEADLRRVKEQLQPQYPVWKKDWSVAVRAPRPLIAERTRPIVFTFVGAVALVLLIACANVANLLLARATRRQQDIALRRALGATTGRLVRQVLTESVLLSLAGGVGGVLLATWIVDLLRNTTADVLPPAIAPQIDYRVLLIGLAVSIATGLLFGALPALRAGRLSVNEALKNGGRTATAGGRTRSQSALIVTEVALSAVLLVSAGLLMRSLVNAVRSDPGFQPERVLAFDISLPALTYPSNQSRLQFANTLRSTLRELPGVENAGTAMALPFSDGGYGEKLTPGDRQPAYSDPGGKLDYVSPGYLETLGAHLLAGRVISETDNRSDAPRVAVINDQVAKRLFEGELPVGKQLRVSGTRYEIIGVIRSLPGKNKDAVPPMFVYVPQAFEPSSFSVVVRSKVPPATLVAAVRERLRTLDEGLPMANVRTLDDAMHHSLGPRRVVLWVIGAFAAASLLLSCIGLYGVMSYTVAARTRELSIRMALGAERSSVLALVMRDGLKLIGWGALIGILAALASGRLLKSQLYGLSSYDPIVLVVSFLCLALIALIACWWPALKATRADALAALRAD